MGCFTAVIHPQDGRELQIKTYLDVCDTYQVGDKVNWEIYDDLPGQGTLLDGVYTGCSGQGPDVFVIIKNHEIFAVLEKEKGLTAEGLATFYQIKPWEREWWSEAVWLLHDIKLCKTRIEELKWSINMNREYLDFLLALCGLPVEEIVARRQQWHIDHAGKLFSKTIIRSLAESGTSHRIFQDKEI
jgi:hypothetical protein